MLIQLPPVILFLPILACLYSFLLQSLLVSYSWAQHLLMLPGERWCGVIQHASLSDFLVREELLELRGRLLRLLSTDLWSVGDSGVSAAVLANQTQGFVPSVPLLFSSNYYQGRSGKAHPCLEHRRKYWKR